MTFDQYCTIIQNSVQTQGYDSFYPSLCLPGDEIKMMVLEMEARTDSDETVAKEWASQFDSKIKYLAYKIGGRRIDICFIIDNDVKDKIRMIVEPYDRNVE